MLPKDPRSWLAFLVFQCAFAAVVFGLTRAWYLQVPATPTAGASGAVPQAGQDTNWHPALPPEMIASLTMTEPDADDPATLSFLADQTFANKDYAKAAGYYERLLAFDPDNADVRNNLALTLHYVGRSEEALAQLRDNVAQHPGHQRSWLTLGFVSRQAGDLAGAREALATAAGIDPESSVGRSAQEMLDAL